MADSTPGADELDELERQLERSNQALETGSSSGTSKEEAPAADSSDAATEKKGKKKKGKKKGGAGGPAVLWTVRLEQKWSLLWGYFKEISRGLFSPDRMTRRMAALFLVSAAGVIGVTALSVHRYSVLSQARKGELTEAQMNAKKISEFIGKQADEARKRHTSLTIGEFTLQLKKVPGQKDVPGVLNMAELELIAECDTRETCLYIQSNLSQARDQVTNVFVELERDDLLSRDGKRKIKKAVIEKLNLWLPKGRVENLYISKLLVS